MTAVSHSKPNNYTILNRFKTAITSDYYHLPSPLATTTNPIYKCKILTIWIWTHV